MAGLLPVPGVPLALAADWRCRWDELAQALGFWAPEYW